MTEKTKTIKVDTRCWWVTPQFIRIVEAVAHAGANHFYVEWNRFRDGKPPKRATVKMDELIPEADIDRVILRMRRFIETAQKELSDFENQFPEYVSPVTLNEDSRIKGNPEQGRDGRDPEIAAMETIVDMFAELGMVERSRIIHWLKGRFDDPPISTVWNPRLHPNT